MADTENEVPQHPENADPDRNLDRRSRWVYVVFAVIALCVIVALARYFALF